jgi:hypothetical protein
MAAENQSVSGIRPAQDSAGTRYRNLQSSSCDALDGPANLSMLGNFVSAAFTSVLAKHSTNFSIVDSMAIGVDRIQRNFEPLRQQVETWRSRQITDEQAKLVIYRAFIESELSVPRSLARDVHRNYFEPEPLGVRIPHDVVPLQRLHFRSEAARSDSVLPGDGKTRNVSPQQQLVVNRHLDFLRGSACGGQSRHKTEPWAGFCLQGRLQSPGISCWMTCGWRITKMSWIFEALRA